MVLLAPWAMAQQALPYSYGFEDNDLSVDGWTVYFGTSLTANNDECGISTDAAKTGDYGFQFSSYSTSGANAQYLISPELSASKGAILQFYYSVYNSWGSEKFKVGYSTTDTNISSFTFGSEVSTNSESWVLSDEFVFPAGTKYVAIYYYANYQYYLYIDDLSFTAPPSCVKPTGLAATLTPGNGTIATLNWTAGGEETAWVLEYGTASDFTGATSVNVSGTPTKNLTGLTAETKYYARVKADCGGDYSDWSATCEFTPTNEMAVTVCDGTATSSNAPIRSGSGTQSEFVYPASMLTALNGKSITSVTFYASTTSASASYTNKVTVYMEEVAETTESTSAWLYNQSTATKVYEGTTLTVTDGIMVITFDEPYEYQGGNLCFNTWANTSAPSVTWKGENPGYASCGYDWSITPPVSSPYNTAQFLPKAKFIFESNAYPKPKNLAVTNITNNSATITWEAPNSDVQSYKYQYREEGGTWNALTSTTALSAPLTGLTGNTTYEFQVQAIYAGNNESAFASTSFTTLCDAFPIPYEFGFETTEIADLNCWTIVDEDGRTRIDDGTILDDAFAHTGDYYFAFLYQDYPDTNPQYMTLISPEITGMVSGLHVEFYYLTDGVASTPYPETFRVGYSTTDNNIGSFTWTSTLTDVVAADYELFRANFPVGTKYVAVQHLSDDMDYLILDDFSFTEAPSCVEPSGLLISSITTTGAALSWTVGGSESAWDIYVTDDDTDVPDDLTTPTYAAVTSHTNYPISGLTSGTTYYVYLRSACDATTHSDWTMPYQFNTECEAISLPYQYDFEDDALPLCWNTIGTNTGWITSSISNTAPQHGSKHFVIQTSHNATGTQYVVLPEVDANYPLNEYEITFYSKLAGTSTSGRTLAVGVMTDPDDATTFVQIGDAFTPTSDYAQYKVRFNTYTGAGQYIAIKHNITSASYYADYTYIDNLEANPIPACIEPSDPTVSNITNHTADLEWTGTSGSYNIDYRTAAYLNANEGGIDEDFTGLTSGIPTDWDNSEGTTTSDSYKWSYYNSGHETAPCLRFNSYNNSSNLTNFLKTPAMNFPAGKTMQLSFWWKNPTGGDFSVYISTDGGTTKTALKEGLTGQSSWKQETISLKDYVGASNVTIHFKGTSNYGSGDAYIYLDDVVVGYAVAEGDWQHTTSTTASKTLADLLAERKYDVRVQGNCGAEGLSEWSGIVSFTTDIACPAPTGLTISNPTSSSFDLQWTNGGSEDWIVAYKKTTDTDFTEVDVNMTEVTEEAGLITYTLGGLEAETDYIVKVQDNCEASYAGDGMSEWTDEVPYSTIAACAAMNPVVSNITHYNATVNFEGESADGFTVKYRTAAGISGLSEEFDSDSEPEGWTRYSGAWNSDGTGPTSTTTSGWSFGAKNFTNSHAYMNMYSDWKYWLVTPSITVGSNYVMNFDAAYTKYNATTTPDQNGTDDRFVVLISTDNKAHWTSLREWNNDGTGDAVLNDLPVTFQPVAPIDLSAYVGETVYIAFYGASTTSNTDNHLRIDNVTIGVTVPAGDWQTEATATTTADLTGLTAGTKYDLKVVPNCDETLESATVQFTTLVGNMKYFLTAGEWGTASNWMDEEIPAITDNATIRANVTITGDAAASKITLQGSPTPTLTIQGNGSLQTDNSVTATVKKTIASWGDGNGNYYLVTTPINTSYGIASTYGMITDNLGNTATPATATYDLYKWDYTEENEWRNYRANTFSIANGTGYLYASKAGVELIFTGTVKANNVAETKNPIYTTVEPVPTMNGYNLYGNPFVCNAYITEVNENESETHMAFYRMNAAGNGFEAATGAIKPMEGIFVQATKSGQSFKFSRTAPVSNPGNGNLNINVDQVVTGRDAQHATDNAIVRFDGGNNLGKFSFREGSTKLYIPQNGKDYAVVNAEAKGEMPLNFKAETTAKYTISISSEDIEFSYLRLIDNFTGANVDLLIDPEYTFIGSPRDDENRFRIVFSTNNAENENDVFVYQNDSELIVNGEGELQIYDVMGRFVTSMKINGSERISADNFSDAMYIFRLVGSDVKTQKIVVR